MSSLLLQAVAEPDKTPFFAAGAALAVWAVVLSAIGLRRPEFPGGRAGSAGVMALTGVLMVAVMFTGITTASRPAHEEGAEAEDHRGGQAAHTLAVAAVPTGSLRYEQRLLRAEAGRVRIVLTNRSPVSHDVRIERGNRTLGGTRRVVNGTASATLELSRGDYGFYCSVAGHREGGMTGALAVK